MDSLAGQISSAVAGFGAGLQGRPNPVENQRQLELRTQQMALRTQLQMRAVQARVAEWRRKSNESQLTMYEGMLGNPDQQTRDWAARGYAQTFKQSFGAEIPPSVLAQLGRHTQKPDAYKRMIEQLRSGAYTDDYFVREYQIPRDELPQHKTAAQNDSLYHGITGRAATVGEIDQLSLQDKQVRLFEGKHPEAKRGGNYSIALTQVAREQFGKPHWALSDDEYASVTERVKSMAVEMDARDAAAKTKAQATARQTASGWTPRAILYAAQLYNSTGKLPPVGMGQQAADIRGRITDAASALSAVQGGIGSTLSAQAMLQNLQFEQRRVMRTRGPAEAFARKAELDLDAVTKLSSEFDRSTGRPLLDRWFLAGRKAWAGDPATAAFDVRAKTAMQEVARVVTTANAQGLVTESSRQEYERLLNIAMTHEQVLAVVEQLRQEMANRVQGYDAEVGHLQDMIHDVSETGQLPAPRTPATKPATAGPLKRPPLGSFVKP